ncbi:DUF4276 family protein [Desulfatirhabdium butyrativorans]|uniref:DUF4276 family protein n=1 Tax=Desulfatirhabdium butyrativorans TaxID=340467 RepID=UPI0004883E5C|nr:DUF4276 family protein [Desulfatirhabdium butyrativorans]
MKLYVEGGGDSSMLKTACRMGFSVFLSKAGLKGKMPRIVACGSRQNAYDSFCTAINSGEDALLLVDSEAPVPAEYQEGDDPKGWHPWQHLKNRSGDQWDQPENVYDADCHLMVQCMEAWFLADRGTLQNFFGQGFNANALPAAGNRIESVAKEQVYKAFSDATINSKTKSKYVKGEHAFKLLALVSPEMVTAASPWAKRLIDFAKAKMGC